MKPQRTNSPMRGNTKLAMYPMLTALNVVRLRMDGSIGSNISLQRSPLNQNATMLAAIESRIYPQWQDRRAPMK